MASKAHTICQISMSFMMECQRKHILLAALRRSSCCLFIFHFVFVDQIAMYVPDSNFGIRFRCVHTLGRKCIHGSINSGKNNWDGLFLYIRVNLLLYSLHGKLGGNDSFSSCVPFAVETRRSTSAGWQGADGRDKWDEKNTTTASTTATTAAAAATVWSKV